MEVGTVVNLGLLNSKLMIQPPVKLSDGKRLHSWLNQLLAYTRSLQGRANADVRVRRGTNGTNVDVKRPRRMSAGGSSSTSSGAAVWL